MLFHYKTDHGPLCRLDQNFKPTILKYIKFIIKWDQTDLPISKIHWAMVSKIIFIEKWLKIYEEKTLQNINYLYFMPPKWVPIIMHSWIPLVKANTIGVLGGTGECEPPFKLYPFLWFYKLACSAIFPIYFAPKLN